MRKLGALTASTALVAVMGFSGTAWANPYADAAVDIDRVTPGQASPANGSVVLNTTADDGDDGSDATGAPDWPPGGGARVDKITSLGYDEAGTNPTGDDSGGYVVLDFTDNACLDGPGADIKLFDASGSQSLVGNESAEIEVSDGVNWSPLGDVAPGGGEAGYELDVSGALAFFNRVQVTAIDWAGQTTLAGFDLDAVECLNSVPAVTVDDGDDVGGGANDVETVYAFSDGTTIFVHLSLGAAIDPKVKYRVHFDYTDQYVGFTNKNPDTETNTGCVTTSDDTMMLRGNRETGPGDITTYTDMLWYEVDYDELAENGVVLGSDDRVLIWAETQYKGINDRAPNTQEPCSKPQVDGEVIVLTLE